MSSSLLPNVYPTWCDVIAHRAYPPNHAPAWPAGMGTGPNPGSPPLHPVALAGYSHRNGYVPLCKGIKASTACPDLGHALNPEWLVYNVRPCTM